MSPAEPPPPPIADAAQVAHQTRTQFMVLAGSVRRALREDLLRLGRLLPELHEMYAAHGPTWSAEDQACARRVLELATGLLEMLQADDPEAQERGRKRMLATLPADEQAALSKPELLAPLVARHEERAPTAPDEGLIAELYLTRLVVHHLRQEDAAPRDPGAGLRPRERVRAALRALLDGALVGKEQLEAYRADPSSPPTRAKDLVEAERLLEEEWALLPSDGRQARGRALQERLEPLARTLLGVSYLAELETFLQLAAILGQDPCSHSRAWFVLHAHRSPPPALLSARIAPPRPHERCRGLLAAREGQGEVKLALRIPRPGKEQRLELALGSKVRVDGKELLVPPEARGWQTALIELDPPAGNLVIHLQDERLGLLGTPLHVPLGGCPPDFAFEEQRGGGALLALDAPAPEPPDPMPGRGRRPPGRRGN